MSSLEGTTVTPEQATALSTPTTWEDISSASRRSSRKSSPGSDGLPYEILGFSLRLPVLPPLVLRLYKEALTSAKFPASWMISLMTLLPKQGDLTPAANYRPIQLVNTDNKIFTRIVNAQILLVVDSLINRHQLGFMPGQFTADHGMLTTILMENDSLLSPPTSTDIGLLLDQEKAYDRVNLSFLQTALTSLAFPSPLITSIIVLFSFNQIQINLNGHLA
ncbi:hypothetical protein A0J61_05053, partial [Choanephora cucurbitarum]